MDGVSDSSFWQKIARFFGAKGADSVEQVIIEASEDGELLKEEGSMLLSVLHLDEMQVQDIMTPRTDVICAPAESTIGEIIELIISSGHSRIPIFRKNRDNIIGLIYAKDILRAAMDADLRAESPEPLMQPPFFVPETKNVLDLLHDFKSTKKHLAIILDEYGGTAGIVSIEDVLEQIVGDIEDEHDAPREDDILRLDDGSLRLSGRAYLADLSEQAGIDIASDDVDTIGGYLSHVAGRVPQAGERFEAAAMVFTVLEADATQVRSIRAVPAATDNGTGNAGIASAARPSPASGPVLSGGTGAARPS